MSLKVYDSLEFAAKDLVGKKRNREKYYEIINKTWNLLQRIEISMLEDADRRLAHVMKDSVQAEVFGSNAKAGYFRSLLSAVNLKQLDEKYNFENMIMELDENKTYPEYVEKAKKLLLEMKPIGIFERRLQFV